MPEEDINIKKITIPILKLLFILIICTIAFATDSNSIELQSVSHIEKVEQPLSEIGYIHQNIQTPWNAKRRDGTNNLNPTIPNTYTPIYSWYYIKHDKYLSNSEISPLKKDIIHLYCVLLI